MTHPKPSSWFVLILIGLMWGASFSSIRIALDGFGPLTISALRISLATVILLIVMAALGHRPPRINNPVGRRIWLACLGMAVFSNALPFTLLGFAIQRVSSGFAGITMATVPLFVLPLAHILLPDHRMSLRKTFGFMIGFIGVVILIGPGSGIPTAPANTELMAKIACVLTAFSYAIGSIITRRAPQGSVIVFSALALLLAASIQLPLALAIEGLPGKIATAPVAAVLYMGVFPTALATLLLVYLIKHEGPAFLSLANYQVPIWAVFLGTIFMGETLPPSFVLALALVLVGLAISQSRKMRLAS